MRTCEMVASDHNETAKLSYNVDRYTWTGIYFLVNLEIKKIGL